MGDLADRRHQLAAARDGFLEGSAHDLSRVPDHVAASWRRSVSSGVRPSEVSSTYFADLDLGSRLVRSSGPVMEQLAEQISGIPMCVALTDNRARLLARRDSNSGFGRVCDRVYFAQGFGYAEGSVGTNGVGTVLEFGESVHIVGAEHFVDTLQPFACAGAPVRDPITGRIEGVLDISCHARHSSPILLSLVRAAALQIERNLLADRNQLQQALFDAWSRFDARGRHAVLAVGPRIVMANTAMQTLLDAGDLEALQDHVRFVTDHRSSVDDRLDLPSGARVRLRGSTVAVGSETAGMVCAVDVIDEIEGGARPDTSRERGCPASRLAARQVREAVASWRSILVQGECGSGRSNLLATLFRARHPGGDVVMHDADDVVAAPRATVAALLAVTAQPTLHVLRDIDRWSAQGVETVLAGLRDGKPDGMLAATALDGAACTRLLELFTASAILPPLRNRSADLPGLVAELLDELAPHRRVTLSRDARRVMARYSWPGNVRQLSEALADALRRRPVGRVEAADLPAWCHSAPRTAMRPVDEIERDAIVTALCDAGGNRVAAAASLGLARSTLYRKIRQYGITA